MSLGDLGRASGIPVLEYSLFLNTELKAIQKIASDYADLEAVPDYGYEESNEDFYIRWNDAFNAKMRECGWKYTADHCMCADPEFGHEPACGWTRVEEVAA